MKKVRKIIAILLTVLTLMSVISAATPVLAVEVTELTENAEESSETLNTEEAEEQTATDEPEILNEMVEWRTESTKYFRNSDGSYTAAQYAYPIHYKENGEWKEIDNTLTEKSISNEEKGFVAENTNTPAIFPEELNQDSNNEISVTAENYTIRFSPNKSQKEFKVSDGKVKDREELNSVKIVESAKEKQEISTFKVSKKAEKPEIKENKRKEKFKVENKSGAIVYENVFTNVDFEYELNNSKLKESIILNEKQDSYIFSFNMDFDGLFPVLCEDGAINLCSDRAGENPVAKIEAPYMVDSNGEYSDAVTMSIKENGKEYILTVTADENWLNDTKRVYPVVIDPTIKLNINRTNTIDCYVDNSQPTTSFPTDYYIYAGHSTLGKTRTFIKFKLPDLPDDNCIITNAFIRFNQNSVDKGSSDGYLTIHEVTENWNNTDSSLKPTWNKQPEYNEKVLDYSKVEYNKDNMAHCYDFDITRTVKEWYENDKLETNYGFMVKALDETKVNRAQLFSAENSVEGAYPAIYVHFRNNKGLESYWDYSSYGVGAVGTAHVNDYTGNLVYELPIASSISEIMPISIVGYYNNYCANELIRETEAENVRTSIGRGFRLNYQQTVLPSSEYGLSGDEAKTYPYVYTDSDGTEHYIQKVIENKGEDNEKTVYKDEDGLGLTLTSDRDENDNLYYKITDKAHNTYYFNFRGNLSRIKDTNGNEMKIIYKEADSISGLLDRSRIDKIVDGAGHTYTFTYAKNSSDKELDYVKTIEDDAGRIIDFDISSGLLTDVKYPDGNIAEIDYNISSDDSSEGRINAVYSNGIYELNFDYTSKKTGRRVKTVKEYGEGTEKGQVITFDRTKYNTTIMRSCGLDGKHYIDDSSKGKDDIITTIQYDNMGRAISQQMKFGSGDEISAGSCAYTTSDTDETASGFKNKVSGSGATGKYVENLLYGGNAESDDYWSFGTSGNVNAEPDISTASKYIGKKSLKLIINEVEGANGRCYYRQNYTDNIKSNTEYTLSAYVKTGDLEAYPKGDLKGAFIQIIGYDSSGNAIESVNARSQIITERTDLNVNNGWRRLSCTVKTGTNVNSLRCYLFLRNMKGSVCFDGIQLEKGGTANDYNMLENSHFTMLKTGNQPKLWEGTSKFTFNEDNGVKTTTGTSGNSTNAVIITGEPNIEKGVTQTVTVEGNPDDTYILSGWAKGYPVNSTYHLNDKDEENATFEIAVKVKYSVSDGSDPVEEFKTPATFNTTITDWQCASVPISLKYSKAKDGVTYTPQSIKIIPRYHNQVNYVYFDKIMLVKDVASSYTYDKDGNLVSAASNGEQKSNMKYDDKDNLTSYTDTAGFTTQLTYEDNNNLNYTKSGKGVYTNYDYDSYGNVISTEVRNKGKIADATAVLKTTSETNSKKTVDGVTINKGAYQTASFDQNNNKTTYTQDHKTGALTKVTDAKGVATVYEYEGNFGKQKSVSTKNSKVTYSYNTNEQLKDIIFGTTKQEKYSFSYDEFGNVSETKVGSQPLSTNTFKLNNGVLEKTVYGNGDFREYSYNNFGQKIVDYVTDDGKEKKAYSWAYNDSGINIRHTDYIIGIQYLFDYDSLGRLSKEEAKDHSTGDFVGSTEYGYDIRNNLTSLITKYGGKANKQQYFYTQVEESQNSVDYQEDNLPTMYKLNNGIHALYRYDGINRLNQRKLVLDANTNLYYNYIYKISDRNSSSESKYRTTQIEEEYIGNDVYIYDYDELENITSIRKAERKSTNYNSDAFKEFKNPTDYVTYGYDDLGQLTRENLAGKKTSVWNYDELGNITSKSEYAYTTVADLKNETVNKTVKYYYPDDEITYQDSTKTTKTYSSWNNILVAVDLDGSNDVADDEIIEYDQIGNPTSYLGATLKWNGRQLTSYKTSDKEISYTYDSNGLRTSKTIKNGVTSDYFYVNGQLHYEERSNGTKLYFFYDSNGYLTGINHNSTNYYPATNKRGDVVAIYNSVGNCIVKYEYDAWGNILSVTDANGNAITDENHIANINPIRYRGYYYDTETELYYLQSRYYNPGVGRFLNADAEISGVGGDVIGNNMFSYCLNNPVNMSDPTGHWPNWSKLISGASLAFSGMVLVAAVATSTCIAPVAAVVFGAVGVAAMVMGTQEVEESFTGYNAVKDKVFNGNETAYNATRDVVSTMTAIGTIYTNSLSVCFVAGTYVLSQLGKIEIQNIKTGDKVWAENPETGQKGLKTVVRTFENESFDLVRVFVNGEEIITTPTHPFYVSEKGWTDAIKLRAGDILVLRNGDYVIIEKVQHEILETPIKVYNFEVEDFHTYYVGSSSILVHNADCRPKATSPNQMQKQVERGQAPRSVNNVHKPHVTGQKPHIHFKDGTSINIDGSVHDKMNGTHILTNDEQIWLFENGWGK